MKLVELELTLAFKIYNKKKSSFVGNLISIFTNSMFYHVELIVDNKWISSNSDSGGITIAPLRALNFNWEYKKLNKICLTEEQYINLMKFIGDQEGKGYDWTGIIFAQILPFKQHCENKWFCSEIVTKLLQLCLVPEVNHLDPADVSPKDLSVIFDCHKPRY